MKVLIVGAGLAGLRTAESMRTHGYCDKITIIGDEPNYPYNRPPLSKSSLTEILDHKNLEFRRSEKYQISSGFFPIQLFLLIWTLKN